MQRRVNPGFVKQHPGAPEKGVSDALLRQANKSGQLNLSHRGLGQVPPGVWRVNQPPPTASVSFEARDEERWWEGKELVKLLLPGNRLRELSEDIGLLPALTVLDVHDNLLTALPRAIGELVCLTRLVLSHNQLAALQEEVCALPSLRCLRLDYNLLTALPPALERLSALEELDLSHNRLASLPHQLGQLDRLVLLRASDNCLSSIPPSAGSLKNLKELSLSKNKLASLPPFSSLHSLAVVDLRYNVLKEVPHIQPALELKELHLGYNRIERLSEARLKVLHALVILDLRDNKIASVPEAIAELTDLERLDLTNNDLMGLPVAMGGMTQLKALSVDGNALRSIRRSIVQQGTVAVLKYLRSRAIPAEPEEHTHHTTKHTPKKHQPPPTHTHSRETHVCSEGEGELVLNSASAQVLDLAKRNLSTLPPQVFDMSGLAELMVGHNRLTSLPPAIGQLCSLTVLDVRNNQLQGLPLELECCSKLREVVLSFNRLTAVPPVLYSIPSLEAIIANDNQIGSIDVKGLAGLSVLATLDLQNNSITQVPPELGTVSSLRHLCLMGNPFRIPRSAVLVRGTQAVLDYLKDRIPQPPPS